MWWREQGAQFALACIGALILAVTISCSSLTARQQAREALQRNDYEGAIATLENELAVHPGDADTRLTLRTVREEYANRLIAQAASERAAGRVDTAESILTRAVEVRVGDERARALLLEVQRDRRAATVVEQARDLAAKGRSEQALNMVEAGLKDHPRSTALIALQRELELEARRSAATPALTETRPVSLDFRDANLRMVLEALTRGTGINVIVDKDIRADLRTTIFLRDAKVEDAIDVIASTNQLSKKIINPTTVLVYPNTPEKAREYQDLMVRAFYLGSVDVKVAAQLLRTTLKIREPFIDEKLNLIVLREPAETIRLAERLLALHDQTDAETMLEVEVLEVSSSRLTDLGIQFPDLISFSVLPRSGSGLTVDDLRDISSGRIGVAPTPQITLNLRKELGDLNVLANPRIRVRSREKARVLIGDKLPVVTSTATSTGFVSESIQYLDVGLKLEVEPTVSLDDEVTIRVNLEVSSLVREIRTAGGSLAYQIGTRSANTVLRLRDGETQLLAGLISNSERRSTTRVPGLGDIPIAGRLFSSQRDDGQRTEIVLSITPRIIRNVRRPDINFAEFWSGTETQLRSRPLTASAGQSAQGVRGAPVQATAAQPLSIAPQPQLTPTPSPVPSGPVGSLNWQGAPAPRVGQEFALPVVLNVATELKGLELAVKFDTKLLDLVNVISGPFFDTSTQRATVKQSATADGALLAVSADGGAGAKGNSVVAIMTFRAKAAGPAEVIISQATPQGAGQSTILTSPGPLPFTISR